MPSVTPKNARAAAGPRHRRRHDLGPRRCCSTGKARDIRGTAASAETPLQTTPDGGATLDPELLLERTLGVDRPDARRRPRRRLRPAHGWSTRWRSRRSGTASSASTSRTGRRRRCCVWADSRARQEMLDAAGAPGRAGRPRPDRLPAPLELLAGQAALAPARRCRTPGSGPDRWVSFGEFLHLRLLDGPSAASRWRPAPACWTRTPSSGTPRCWRRSTWTPDQAAAADRPGRGGRRPPAGVRQALAGPQGRPVVPGRRGRRRQQRRERLRHPGPDGADGRHVGRAAGGLARRAHRDPVGRLVLPDRRAPLRAGLRRLERRQPVRLAPRDAAAAAASARPSGCWPR